MTRLLPLVAILTAAWTLVLVGSVIIFTFIVPLEIPGLDRFGLGTLKVVGAAVLVVIWFLIMVKLRDAYAAKIFRYE